MKDAEFSSAAAPANFSHLFPLFTIRKIMPDAYRQRFVPVESCLDYNSYVHKMDQNMTQAQHAALRRELIALGRAIEERMGITYVRGPWGFFVIPQPGYPTLKVSFFHDTPDEEIDAVMDKISNAFESPNITNHLGELHE